MKPESIRQLGLIGEIVSSKHGRIGPMRMFLPVMTSPVDLRNSLRKVPPEINAIRTVRSFNLPGWSYRISFEDMSCTCSNWLAERGKYDVNDIRRLCKHHVSIFVEHDLFMPAAAQLAIGQLMPFPAKRYCITELSSRTTKITAVRYREGDRIDDCIDVLVPTPLAARPLDRFQLSTKENRWSSALIPWEAELVKEMVDAWLRTTYSDQFVN